MKKFIVIKSGIETNSWIESAEMGADYWEPCFGEKGTYKLVEEEFDPDAQKAKQEALDYLAKTDWMVIRFAETGLDIPNDVAEWRRTAREKASEK